MSNRFLTNKHESKFVTKNNLDVNNLDMFPELKTNIPQTNINTANLSFKNVLNTKAAETNDEEPDIILPGWIKLTRNKNIKKKDKVDKIEEIEDNLNEVMDQTIFKMQCKWYQYEYIYDQIHGEGAYFDKFVLPPIYGEEYETDTETEEENSDYIASDDDTMYNEYDMFD
jgi:hypothetical protein